MDIAEDADGRVSIFTVEAEARAPADDPVAGPAGGPWAGAGQLGRWLDAPNAALAIFAILTVVLVLGLVLLRR